MNARKYVNKYHNIETLADKFLAVCGDTESEKNYKSVA